MNLAKFPRREYTYGATPIEKLERLSAHLNRVNIYIKRDDLLMGLLGGGNKVRQLEFLMAEAISTGADTVITCGAVQSNHCRLTLAASNKEGLDCHLVIEERIPGSYSKFTGGNSFLYGLMGVKSVNIVPGGSDMYGAMQKVANSLEAQGRKPHILPMAGSSAIGALGYVACAREIIQQLYEAGLEIDTIVCPSGSGGTQAGLLSGIVGSGSDIPVVGVATSRGEEAQRELVFKRCEETSDLLGLKNRPSMDDVVVKGNYIGVGYALPTKEMVDAVKLLARTEGILFDPVYTGKAMSGLIDMAQNGYFKPGQNVLFLHTGGTPVLYAYPADLFE